MPFVVLQKAVVIFAIVTQEQFAVTTVPKRVVSLVLVVTTVVTPMLFIRTLHRKVGATESFGWWCCLRWPTRTLPRAIASNETLRQLCAEGLQISDAEVGKVLT